MGRVSWKTNLLPKEFYSSLIKKKDISLSLSVKRSQKFLKDFEKFDVDISNGKSLQKLAINSSFLNYSAGEFVNTRSSAKHKNSSKKKR